MTVLSPFALEGAGRVLPTWGKRGAVFSGRPPGAEQAENKDVRKSASTSSSRGSSTHRQEHVLEAEHVSEEHSSVYSSFLERQGPKAMVPSLRGPERIPSAVVVDRPPPARKATTVQGNTATSERSAGVCVNTFQRKEQPSRPNEGSCCTKHWQCFRQSSDACGSSGLRPPIAI